LKGWKQAGPAAELAQHRVEARDQPVNRVHAQSIGEKKYCSASIMLGKTAEISRDFEILEA